MASTLISNSLHIAFDSVFGMDDAGLVQMFESFIATGLKEFLGCPAVLYEDALVEFFEIGSVRDGMMVSTIGGTTVEISEEIFAAEFELPMEGLTDLSEVPKDLVFDARSLFSESKEQVSISCHKREMKIEYRLLSDILAKTIYVKAGSFDAVTRERFLLMTAITFDVKVNWSRLLFDILKDMVTPGSRQAKGYAIEICVLLKNVSGLALGDSKAFSSPRILTEKTVHKYVVINEKVGAEEVTDEPRVKKAPKTKAASKKKRAVELEVVPLQTIEPTPVEESILEGQREATSDVPIDEETTVEEQPAVEVAAEAGVQEPVDESVDEQVAESTADEETVVEDIVEKVDEPVSLPAESDVVNKDEDDQDAGTFDVGDKTVETTEREKHWFNLSYEEIIVQMTERPVVTPSDTDEEMGTTVGTNVGVQTESCQYDSFVEEPLKGAEQVNEMAMGDAEQSMGERTDADDAMSLEDIFLKIPVDCPIPSVGVEVTRITLGKCISILGVNEGGWYKADLPKIPETDKGKAPLQERDPVKGSSATDLEILEKLSDVHMVVIEDLKEQTMTHGLKWEKTCCSNIFEGRPRDPGAIITRSNTNFPSKCWIRTKTMVDGSLVIQQGTDMWETIPRTIASFTFEVSRQRSYNDTLPPMSDFFKLMKKRWGDVCIEVAQFFASGKLLQLSLFKKNKNRNLELERRRSAGALSVDDISSDVIIQQEATALIPLDGLGNKDQKDQQTRFVKRL
ncbi:hypothetical protein F511_07234 [Dorcoceras hygrometricum]|uniref:Dystroglycan-like n=1 Tax=Dorcoceras hygrometricum TaxID=472368 RepID=A0A2Z7ATA4_9LAMI|nr:hypothetical protein F511_07234 [Dorcoceras hygrometricum]